MPKTEEKQAVKAVIYARYSSDRQREESIEGQLRVCETTPAGAISPFSTLTRTAL